MSEQQPFFAQTAARAYTAAMARTRTDGLATARLRQKPSPRGTAAPIFPPTLAQAMMVPEVRELVEAFKVLLEAHESGWIAGEDWGAAARARAALHRIGETK